MTIVLDKLELYPLTPRLKQCESEVTGLQVLGVHSLKDLPP